LPALLARGALRVGMHPGLIPFVAVGADADELARLASAPAPLRAVDGRAVYGFDVELMEEAVRALGVRLEIVLVDKFDDLVPGLLAGQYDVIASALTRTLARATRVTFSDPYFASGLEVRVRDAARFSSLASLRRAEVRVAVRAGTTAAEFAGAQLAGATLVSVASIAELYAAMDDPQRADAVVIDTVSARDATVRQRVRARLATLEERRFTTERFAFAARPGDPDWVAWLDLFLAESKTSGAFQRRAARFNAWFQAER
jgi:polar amino acid transport system substrate-binding protein